MVRTFLFILMTAISSESTLSTCSTICTDQSNNSNTTHCYGGGCLLIDKDYNRFIVPHSEKDWPLQIKLIITIFSISNINIDEGTFELEMWLQLSWQDDRMRVCQCKDRGNRKFIKLSGEMDSLIWIPDVQVMNLLDVERQVGISRNGGIRLVHHETSTGVLLDMRVQTVLDCHFIASWFPFDNNRCVVRIGSGLHPASQMLISMDTLPDLKMTSNSGFNFTLEMVKSEKQFSSSRYSEGEFRLVGFKIGFQREEDSIILEYMVIIGIMVFMTTLTVILPSDTVDRLGPIGVILIGALTVYYTVSLEFPRADSGPSPLVMYVLAGLGICYFSLLEFVVLLKLRLFKNTWVEMLDKTFLVLGFTTWMMSTVMIWVWLKQVASSCNGRGNCYHNV